MDSISVAIAAGLSLGLMVGYRVGPAVVRKVAGPFAGRPLAIALSIGGAIGFLIPAAMFAILGTRSWVAQAGGGVDAVSLGKLVGIVAAIGISVGSGLVVAAFAGALCARFIGELHSRG